MPHVCFTPLTGFRIGTDAVRELGMTLPGLQQRGEAIGRLPSLACLTLAGMLPEDWTCEYTPVDAVTDEAIHAVVSARPDLVAISALTASVEEAYRLSTRLRSEGLQTVFGGLHATACPEEALQHCDAVAVGEGEQVWAQIIDDTTRNNLQGIYRADPQRRSIAWAAPRFDLLGSESPPRYTLQTQRGCPLACEFCGASRLLSRFREKPLENIRSELKSLAALSPRLHLELADDNTFAGDRDRVALCDLLGEFDVRYFTECDWRIGERPELLSAMAASGCVQVLVGIESLVFRYPGMGQKQSELDRVMTAVDAIQSHGIVVNGCFIVGADGETQTSIDRLVDFLGECPLAEVQLTLQTPFPGTGLYRRLERAGRLLPDRGWSHYTLFDVTTTPDAMSVAELERGFRGALAAVYSPAAHRRRAAIRSAVWRNNPSLHREVLLPTQD
jgi:radical SAM superfamily enzyme YgiQ (UPF0313 family)